MTIGTFDTAVLNRVVDNLDQPASFLLDLAFREEQTETSEEIHFDVESDKPRITPFVHPMRAGKVVNDQGFETNSFRPAYAKDKRVFDPSGPLKRAVGEQIGGTLSPEERRSRQVRASIDDQLRMLTRREEVMAAEALVSGKVTVKGDGYPEAIVDFQRDASLDIALTGANLWSDASSNPMDDVEEWAGLIQSASGAVGTTVVMDPLAWRIARAKDSFTKLLDLRRGSTADGEIGPINRGQRKARRVATAGDFDFWVYQDTYVDPIDGATKKLIPDNTAMVLDPIEIMGVRAYGAIRDEEAGFQARRFFSKSWAEQDPAVRYLLLQSAPLVVPYRVNASLTASVA